jgi:hypothetical protein
MFSWRLPAFFFLLGLDEGFQTGQLGLPENTILFQPRINRLQRLRIELVKAMPALAPLLDQMRSPQQPQMLRDRRPRNWKRLRNLPRRLPPAPPQEIKHRATSRVGQSAKDHLRRICNRTVPHYP